MAPRSELQDLHPSSLMEAAGQTFDPSRHTFTNTSPDLDGSGTGYKAHLDIKEPQPFADQDQGPTLKDKLHLLKIMNRFRDTLSGSAKSAQSASGSSQKNASANAPTGGTQNVPAAAIRALMALKPKDPNSGPAFLALTEKYPEMKPLFRSDAAETAWLERMRKALPPTLQPRANPATMQPNRYAVIRDATLTFSGTAADKLDFLAQRSLRKGPQVPAYIRRINHNQRYQPKRYEKINQKVLAIRPDEPAPPSAPSRRRLLAMNGPGF